MKAKSAANHASAHLGIHRQGNGPPASATSPRQHAPGVTCPLQAPAPSWPLPRSPCLRGQPAIRLPHLQPPALPATLPCGPLSPTPAHEDADSVMQPINQSTHTCSTYAINPHRHHHHHHHRHTHTCSRHSSCSMAAPATARCSAARPIPSAWFGEATAASSACTRAARQRWEA